MDTLIQRLRRKPMADDSIGGLYEDMRAAALALETRVDPTVVDAAERHIELINKNLRKEEWTPRRSHVEQARNTLRALVRAIHDASGVIARWHHRKRGSTYAEVARGTLQVKCSCCDCLPIVIYRAHTDGSWWARPISEFEDGRFVRVE